MPSDGRVPTKMSLKSSSPVSLAFKGAHVAHARHPSTQTPISGPFGSRSAIVAPDSTLHACAANSMSSKATVSKHTLLLTDLLKMGNFPEQRRKVPANSEAVLYAIASQRSSNRSS